MFTKLYNLTFLLGDIHDALFGVCVCARARVCVSFQHRNNLTEFHETWCECHITDGHRDSIIYNQL